jgi:two-component system NtrC family sensor kinase
MGIESGRSNAGPDSAGWRRATSRLSPKLILSLTVIVVIVQGVSGLISLQIHQRELLEEMMLGVDQLSGTITHGTWHAMLADRRQDAYQMMQNMARQPGIEKIRIFNKEGRVVFSTGSEGGAMVDKNAEACNLCHAENRPLVRVDVPSRVRIFRRPSGGRVLAMVTPIYNEGSCSRAECHAHPAEIQVLGVLDVSMSLDRVDRQMAGARWRALGVTLLTIALTGTFIALFVRRFVGRPIRRLILATEALSQMELDHAIDSGSRDEIGELARSFDLMRLRLKEALREINDFTLSLEKKVEERTRQLRSAQEDLIRQDRLASLGQLSASIAHEINNPISGVRNLAMLMDRILREDGIPPGRIPEFRGYLTQLEAESTRVGQIVSDLLSFSRQSRPQRDPTDLNAIVRNTVALVSHKLAASRVEVVLALQESAPPVPCDRAQIMQVVLNLLMNAAEAMPGGGTVTIQTRLAVGNDSMILEVRDQGSGIPEEHLNRVFDPFFTTKEDGKGVGLGLAVVYGIVNGHGGTIEIRSRAREGTTFRVALPLQVARVEA